MSAEQFEQHLDRLRATVARCWTEEGVKSVVELLEMQAARSASAAILPGATEHDQGQAYGIASMIHTLRAAVQR